MNTQLVLGGVGYGLDTSGNPITNVNNINNLKEGSYLVLADGKIADINNLSNKERVQFAVALKGMGNITGASRLQLSVPIVRRNVLYIDREEYTAPVTKIVEVDCSSVPAGAVGDATIVLSDNSYNRTIKNARRTVSVYKKGSMTIAAMLTALVAKINDTNKIYPFNSPFVTASATTTKITFTVLDANTDFSVSLDGLFESLSPVVTREAVVSVTDARDILATEREYSGNLGNGGYEKLPDAWFSLPQQTDLNEQYDVFNIKFKGEHDTPQNKVGASVMWLKIAVPTGAADDFSALLDTLFNGAFDAVEGSIVVNEDATKETDGNPNT